MDRQGTVLKPKVYRQGSGCLPIGIFLAWAGVAFLVSALARQSLIGGVASALTLAFSVLFLRRREIVLDPHSRQVLLRTGILFAPTRWSRPFADVAHVVIRTEPWSGESTTHDVYPIWLEGPDLKIRLVLETNHDPARRRADEIAQLLGVAIVDRSSGE